MTTGSPLYLVSACSSAEEFVAAFRRYADRTGLFVPSSAPLPAGRRGRLAVTLRDGGVMIEGEAEILQSSSKPTVLHGRPGMTVKFIDPDAPSKIVIGELEKARLAMKPPPPSVPPRPAQIPAEPRPVVPAPGGRIDATNALAECVVIGDVSSLKETAGAPRPIGDHKSGPKFSVPAIPSAPARPKTPSTPPTPRAPGVPAISVPSIGAKAPDTATKPPASGVPTPAPKTGSGGIPTAAPRTPSGGIPTTAPKTGSGGIPTAAPRTPSGGVSAPKTPSGGIATTSAPKTPSSGTPAPKTPSGGVATTSAPKTPSSGTPAPKMTSIGFPIVDKLPAAMGVAPAVPVKPENELLQTQVDSGLLQTKLGTEAPPNPTSPAMAAQNPLLETKLGHAAPRPDATPPPNKFVNNATTLGMPALEKAPAKPNAHEETTSIGTGPAKPAELAQQKPITDEEATTIGEAPAKKQTDPMPAAAPVAAKPETSGSARGSGQHKATSIGFPVVRNPFETQPLGLVPPAQTGSQKAFPEPTPEPAPPTLPKSGRTGSPGPRGKNPTAPPLSPRHPTPVAPVPIVRPPAKAAPVVEEEKTDLNAAPPPPTVPAEPPPEARPNRSGGMRASEILAAIPTGDWTMSPDESVPHALPPEAKVSAAAPQEPTPAPAPPPGPPTGNWMIALDPETGWSEPEKLPPGSAPAPAPQPEPAKQPPKSGNPDMAVASDKPITAVQWDEKPTGIGESKIEIDPTLMQPHRPMPGVEESSSSGAAYEATAPASPSALTARAEGDQIPPPLAPMPPRPNTGLFADAAPLGPPPPGFPMGAPIMTGYPTAPSVHTAEPAKRKKMIAMAVGAGVVAIGAIVLLVITLSGGKEKPKPQPAPQPGSAAKTVQKGSAEQKIETPTPQEGSQVAVTPAVDAAVEKVDEKVEKVDEKVEKVDEKKPAPTGKCVVNVTSTPSGADILLGKQKLGTTPEKIELPCGVEAKLTLRKKGSPNTTRSFTPNDPTSKLAVKLGKTLFQVKVTSTPAGATITVGGKSMGVTPTTIKLPAFEATSLTLKKPGFSADTQKVSPRQNNISHHVTLKRGR